MGRPVTRRGRRLPRVISDSDTRPYVIERRVVLPRTDTPRVSILTLGEGHEVPWHYHSEVTGGFYCLEGTLSVETRAPAARHPNERRRTTPPMTPRGIC